MQLEVILSIGVVLLSFLLTGVARRMALLHGVLDLPNQRSSHTIPTPRGGGLAIAISATAGWLTLGLFGSMRIQTLIALVGGGAAVAAVGYMDDRRGVSVGVRFSLHVVAACWACWWLNGVPPLQVGTSSLDLGWFGQVLGIATIVWVLNLFNFMDGIDGLAGSQAVFMCLAAVLIACLVGDPPVAGAIVLAAACAGFLLWNWPPAKIFMGDVGSGYLGFAIAVLALQGTRQSAHVLWIWLVLGATFFVDATVTLLRRLARGERVFDAHRMHAYQHLARRWQSHGRATLAIVGVNFVWLLPCALFAAAYPQWAVYIVVIALAPMIGGAFLIGSGEHTKERRE